MNQQKLNQLYLVVMQRLIIKILIKEPETVRLNFLFQLSVLTFRLNKFQGCLRGSGAHCS